MFLILHGKGIERRLQTWFSLQSHAKSPSKYSMSEHAAAHASAPDASDASLNSLLQLERLTDWDFHFVRSSRQMLVGSNSGCVQFQPSNGTVARS
jgi:hypothetical protein